MRAALAVPVLALVVAWPRLGGEPPALPDDRPVPVGGLGDTPGGEERAVRRAVTAGQVGRAVRAGGKRRAVTAGGAWWGRAERRCADERAGGAR